MMHKFIFILFCCMLHIQLWAQRSFEDQLPKDVTYNPADVIDSIHGIMIYERLNHRLSWDSVRHCKGYACDGIVKDFYSDGNILHKGIYKEGQLINYTNFYPNGKHERYFRIIDDFKSEMILYYPSGSIKSKHVYKDYVPVKWEDYYLNGRLSYYMEYDEKHDVQTVKRFYDEYGVLRSELFLSDSKKMIFRNNEYYPSGVPQIKGVYSYDEELHYFTKEGKWTYYNEDGTVSKVETYKDDKLLTTK
jgi:antitoxin component YwqK of YwqJK toxin-antitoxin module